MSPFYPCALFVAFANGLVCRAYQYMWDQKHFGKLTIKIE